MMCNYYCMYIQSEPGICRRNEDSIGNENRKLRGKNSFRGKKSTIFFLRTARRCRQMEGTKLIFIVNFSVLEFFKVASRMPQIAQVLVSTFKNFRRWGAGGIPPNLPRKFLFFFISNSRLCTIHGISCCVQARCTRWVVQTTVGWAMGRGVVRRKSRH